MIHFSDKTHIQFTISQTIKICNFLFFCIIYIGFYDYFYDFDVDWCRGGVMNFCLVILICLWDDWKCCDEAYNYVWCFIVFNNEKNIKSVCLLNFYCGKVETRKAFCEWFMIDSFWNVWKTFWKSIWEVKVPLLKRLYNKYFEHDTPKAWILNSISIFTCVFMT